MSLPIKIDPASGREEAGPIKPDELSAGLGNVSTFQAGETLGGHKAVYVSGGQAFLADYSDADQAGRIVGMTMHSATAGEDVEVKIAGTLNLQSWGLLPGTVYFLASSGNLTATPPSATGFIQKIGVARDSNNLEINISYPILL
ncbi:MAG: hypothetical protein ACLFQX_08200 [Candidatus Kapaibacterium sp.]